MQYVKVRSHIGKNQLLQLQPPEIEGNELEIILVYQPISPEKRMNKLSDRIYASIQDESSKNTNL